MSKNTEVFDKICGDCAGLNLQNVSAEDVLAQAKIYGASEDDIKAAVLGLAEYRGVTETATCKECGLEFPADDPLADVFGPSEIKCPRCEPYIPGTAEGPSEEELALIECEQSVVRQTATCEICGAEIKNNRPNFYTLFGQRACSENCMHQLSRRQRAETSKKLFGGK